MGPPGGVLFKLPNIPGLFNKLITILEVCALFILLLAAADPVRVEIKKMYKENGVNVYFIVDISPSMAGLDMTSRENNITVSRFTAAKTLILDFADKRSPSDSIGIIAVGDEAAITFAPSTDRLSLKASLERLSIGSLGNGTALGTGLSFTAMLADNKKVQQKKPIAILITDGENNAGTIHPLTAAELLYRAGVELYIIGVGSKGTIPIDYIDPQTHIRHTGSFESYFDGESLIELAGTAGGSNSSSNTNYFYAQSFDEFVSALDTVFHSEISITNELKKRNAEHVSTYFIIFALITFCIVHFIRLFILGDFI